MDLIEVANRLCQPTLVAHVESVIVDVLSAAVDGSEDLAEIVLALLEPAQVGALFVTVKLLLNLADTCSGTRRNLKVGGGGTTPAQSAGKKIFGSCPFTFWPSTLLFI